MARSISIALLLFVLSSPLCAQDSLTISSSDTLSLGHSRTDTIIAYAKSLLGTTYVYGSKSPERGFDCSGFLYHVFTKHNVDVPRATSGWGDEGVEVPLAEARAGDLLLFTGTDPSIRRPGHIGLVVSAEGEPVQFIHSSSSRKHYGVVITTYEGTGYPKRFLKVIRIL